MRDTENLKELIRSTDLIPEDFSLKIERSKARLRAVIEKYRPIKLIGLMSGGHDSFSACYMLSLVASDFEIAHINTGWGIEATREYVRQTCRDRGWPLREVRAVDVTRADGTPDPQIYEDIVRRFGFPGPGWHGKIYQRLKERCLRMIEWHYGAHARGKRKKRLLYVNGARMQESKRRMANADELKLDGRRIWSAPIIDWTKLDTSKCLELAKQPRNLVVDLIHMSGECLCGAMADDNRERELLELSLWEQTRPMYDKICALQNEVKPKKGWGWGERPPRKQVCKMVPGQLCFSCMK